MAENSTSSWRLLACPKERAARSHESSRGAPAQHDYNDSTTHGHAESRPNNQHEDRPDIQTAIQTQAAGPYHTDPRVCSQAMPEVTRDKEMRKSKRGRQLVHVEYTAQGTAHRTPKIYRSCKFNTNISPKHSYTQIACEGLCIF